MSLDLSRLKAERIAKGLTQEEMAQKMGWSSRGPYTKRESGDIDIGVNEFLKIIAILGYSKEQAGIFLKMKFPKKNTINNKEVMRGVWIKGIRRKNSIRNRKTKDRRRKNNFSFGRWEIIVARVFWNIGFS